MRRQFTEEKQTAEQNLDTRIGTFRPSHQKPKKPIPFSIKQIEGNGVGAEVKKISHEDLFSVHKNRFEKAFIDSLVKKGFAPEQIMRVLEIFQDHEEDRLLVAKEKNPVMFAEFEYRRLGISVPAAPILRTKHTTKRITLPSIINLIPEDVIKEVREKITLNDIRTGRYKKSVSKKTLHEDTLRQEIDSPAVQQENARESGTVSRLKEIEPLYARLEELYGDSILKYAGPISTSVQEPRKVSPVHEEKKRSQSNWRTALQHSTDEHTTDLLKALETTGNEDTFFANFASLSSISGFDAM
jgi:hypothetical protein